MNSEVRRLEEQLRRSFEGPAWHGPSVLEVLSGVTPAMAHTHPVAAAHSIWELALHLRTDYTLILRRLEGNGAPLTAGEDWPPVPEPTDSNWRETLHTLRELNRQLRDAVLRFPVEDLDKPLVASSPYTAYTQFIGATQHGLYHAGQIAILKKALDQDR